MPVPNLSVDSALDLLTNLSSSYPGLLGLLEAVCWVGGSGLVILGLYKVREGASPQAGYGTSYSGWISVVIGVLLVFSPQLIRSLAHTLWLGGECMRGAQFMDYVENCSELEPAYEWFRPVVQFIQFYGFFAFVRGLFLLNRSAKVGGGANAEEIFVKAVTHVGFGLACIYIVDFMKVLSMTFGFSMLELFN